MGLWAATRLIATGMERGIAAPNARFAAKSILALMDGHEPEYRYIVFTFPEIHRGEFKAADEAMAFAAERKAERVEIIDLKGIASAVPKEIREIAADIENW